MPQIVTVAEITETEFAQLFDQFEGQLEDKIDAAEEYVKNFIGFDPVHGPRTEIVEVTGKTLFLSNYPVTAVTSVEYSYYPQGSWQAINLANVYINTRAGFIRTPTLTRGMWARVIYDSGYPTIPADLKQAVVLKTALMTSPDYEIFGSGDSKEPGLGHYRREVERLLEPYRKRGMG